MEVSPSVPLGLGPADVATSHTLAPGDRLLLFTDGLIEARNRQGEFMPRPLIEAAVLQPSVQESLDALLDSVEGHAGAFNDDLALLLLAVDPIEMADSPAGPAVFEVLGQPT